MKFSVRNNSLFVACEEAMNFLKAAQGLDFVELFSVEDLRTVAQNAKLWPMLTDISRQVQLLGASHDPWTWKHILTAAWAGQKFVRGIDDTVVVVPVKTSRLSKKRFAELIEAIYAYGGQEGVRWSDPSLRAYEQYREAA